MSFLDVSRRYLKRLGISFETVSHKAVESTFEVPRVAGIQAQQLVKTVLLADERGAILVSLAADQGLDFEALNTQLKRQLSLAHARQHYDLLHGFAPIMLPPWHRLYDLPWVVEHSLRDQPQVYLASGSSTAVFRLEQSAFAQLSADAQTLHFGKRPRNYVNEARQTQIPLAEEFAPVEPVKAGRSSLHERLAQGLKLPVMPGITAELVALKTSADRSVIGASAVIEQDPVLTANLLRYAASPFFFYRGALGSVQEAINHVLGLDQALDMAIGLSLCSHFRGPKEGRLGLASLWRDAFYSATVSQVLAASTANERALLPGSSFLAGLLHNIGYLVLAQMFPTEYGLFNRMVSQQQILNVLELEQKTLGVSHTEAGRMVLAAWGLDEMLQVTAVRHHDEEYTGEHSAYVHLVGIADWLLAQQGIGDMPPLEISPARLLASGLDYKALELCRDLIATQHADLDHIVAKVLAAA